MNNTISIRDTLNEEFIKKVRSKYGKRFEAVAKVYPGISEERLLKLGVLLENTEQKFARCGLFESTQVSNIKDGLKYQYFDIITAAFPGLIAEDLFSVQPLQQKMGQIFWLKYVYGSDKGKIKKGQTIFGPHGEMAGYDKSFYTSETVEEEVLFSQDTGGSATTFTGNISYIPVIPGTIAITMGSVKITDDGNGNLSGTGVSGTINYETGAYSVTFTSAPAAGDAYVNYEYDLGFAPSTIPEIDIKVVDTVIQARPRKLRGLYSLDAGYDLKQAQGIDIQDTLLEAASAQLKQEIDGELIRDVYTQAGTSVTWNSAYNNQTQHLSRREYYEDFVDTLISASSRIRQSTKRVEANWIVVGKHASDILTFIGAPRFVSSGNTTAVGPHFAGTLDGKWKIFVDPFLGEEEFLLGYKGNTLIDAGLIYAPYLPFFATETVMLDDFIGRRGFASSYGKKMVNPNLYVKGLITT